MTSRCQGLFPPRLQAREKALGTRLVVFYPTVTSEDVCWGIRNVKSLIKVLQHALFCHVCNRSLCVISVKMKRFHWLLCIAKNRDWTWKITPLSNLTRASPLVKWKLTAKAELNCEIYKSWRKKAWTLPWKLQELEKYPRKTCGFDQPRGHLIRVLNERSVNDGGDFCVLWLVILKSAWYSVGDTF